MSRGMSYIPYETIIFASVHIYTLFEEKMTSRKADGIILSIPPPLLLRTEAIRIVAYAHTYFMAT
jgi:hypothetical protein